MICQSRSSIVVRYVPQSYTHARLTERYERAERVLVSPRYEENSSTAYKTPPIVCLLAKYLSKVFTVIVGTGWPSPGATLGYARLPHLHQAFAHFVILSHTDVLSLTRHETFPLANVSDAQLIPMAYI